MIERELKYDPLERGGQIEVHAWSELREHSFGHIQNVIEICLIRPFISYPRDC